MGVLGVFVVGVTLREHYLSSGMVGPVQVQHFDSFFSFRLSFSSM